MKQTVEEIKKNIDFKNLSYSDYVLMYDLLLLDNPELQSDIETTVIRFKEMWGVDVSERQIRAAQDSTLNTDIEDLRLYYPE